jgi:phosphomannomutase
VKINNRADNLKIITNEQIIHEAIAKSKEEIPKYLVKALNSGKIDEQLYQDARKNTDRNLNLWLFDENIDRISPQAKAGIINYINNGKWEEIVNAFRQDLMFGTGGIRGMMAFDRKSIVQLKEEGIDAPILKGPNTMNNLVVLLKSIGVAKFGKDPKRNFNKIVIGYDSRIRGADLAAVVAQLFLARGYTVFFFDAPCSYPEVTFAIPQHEFKADIGILISASHNDYRYNGYKLSCGNGSQFDPEERNEMYDSYIMPATFSEVELCQFKDASEDKLVFLGGNRKLTKNEFESNGKKSIFDYKTYADPSFRLINIHEQHRGHVRKFLNYKNEKNEIPVSKNPLKIGYCAFHGAGALTVPALFEGVGFSYVWKITRNHLNEPDGLFPSFCYEPGKEQQPDPGDPRAAQVAVDAFKAEFPGKFEEMDILIGTDPDADRCGVVVKVPQEQRFLYDNLDWTLLPADEMWALILWYRLHWEAEQNNGIIPEVEKKFVALSITTSDCITKLAKKYGIGVVKTWVGFASLSAAIREIWEGHYAQYLGLKNGRNSPNEEKTNFIICECSSMDDHRSINIGAMEQSNGFSILGGPPPDSRSLGINGHVRDKDGTFAAFLIAEIAAWAKEHKTTIYDLIDEKIYLESEIGLFVTGYEPDPMDGEYPGIEGDRIKKAILRRALGYFQMARAGDLVIAGLPVRSACIYRTGKYDALYPPTYDFQFPDEGIRFFFDDKQLNHATIRPSGTGNSLRFHTQLHSDLLGEGNERKADLIKKKKELRSLSDAILDNFRELLKAPRC